jgi:hypothetical protein
MAKIPERNWRVSDGRDEDPLEGNNLPDSVAHRPAMASAPKQRQSRGLYLILAVVVSIVAISLFILL